MDVGNNGQGRDAVRHEQEIRDNFYHIIKVFARCGKQHWHDKHQSGKQRRQQ